jgi:hypothetical protein
MKILSPLAWPCTCAVLAIFLSGCNPPIMTDRSASNHEISTPAAMPSSPIRIG